MFLSFKKKLEEIVLSQQPKLPHKINGCEIHRIKNKTCQRHKLNARKTPKLELEEIQTKAPVCILQELLDYRGLDPPEYQLVNIEGAIHPIFCYEVKVEGLSALGTGRTKNEAILAAAKAMLALLVQMDYLEGDVEINM